MVKVSGCCFNERVCIEWTWVVVLTKGYVLSGRGIEDVLNVLSSTLG
jgi:hypothetical protein